jgi:hypothetical protein
MRLRINVIASKLCHVIYLKELHVWSLSVNLRFYVGCCHKEVCGKIHNHYLPFTTPFAGEEHIPLFRQPRNQKIYQPQTCCCCDNSSFFRLWAHPAKMSLTNCRFYEEKYPEIDSFVMVNVKQVRFPHCVRAILLGCGSYQLTAYRLRKWAHMSSCWNTTTSMA